MPAFLFVYAAGVLYQEYGMHFSIAGAGVLLGWAFAMYGLATDSLPKYFLGFGIAIAITVLGLLGYVS